MTIRVAAIEVNRSLPDLPADPYIALADQAGFTVSGGSPVLTVG